MYADEILSKNIIQWETQSTTTWNSPTGLNLRNIGENDMNMHVFIRKYSGDTFTYVGHALPLKCSGEKPITFKLELKNELPKDIYSDFTRIVK